MCECGILVYVRLRESVLGVVCCVYTKTDETKYASTDYFVLQLCMEQHSASLNFRNSGVKP